MQLANQEAQRFRHEYVGTEHILLGLVAEGSGVAANVLKNLDIDPGKIRREVEVIVRYGSGGEVPAPGRLPQTPRSKKVIEFAIQEARALNHNYVGTEHLLLGLLREQEGVAAQVLLNLGLELEAVHREVMNLLGHSLAVDAPREDVFRIPKSLMPGDAQPYPVTDLWDDEPAVPLAEDPDATRPAVPPDVTADQLQIVKDRVRRLNEQAQAFVAEQDFVLAARCRDEAEALARLLMWYERRRKS
jgi:ATP-dependent Clp protease ATP-binding subunit ClpA